MVRRCFSSILMMALVMATSAPTFAAGGLDAYFGTPNNGFDSYRRSAELTAGVYLRIPFSGRPGRSLSKSRFGLAFGARLPAYDRYDNVRMLADMPKLLDLSIGLAGKESLRLNGLSIIDAPTFYADEDGTPKKKKRRIWPWVVGGVLVLSVLAAVAIKKSIKRDANAVSDSVANAICLRLTGKPCTGT